MFVHESSGKLEQVLDAAVRVDASVHRAQKEQNPHFTIDDRLTTVAIPTVVVCGSSDSVVDPGRQHDMAGKLPRSKEIAFSGEGHMFALEQPDTVVRESLAFIEHDVGLLMANTSI